VVFFFFISLSAFESAMTSSSADDMSDVSDGIFEHCAVLRQSARGQWDAEADELLLRTLGDIQQRLLTRMKKTDERVQRVYTDTCAATTALENALNSLALLAHKQFVQHRIAEYDSDEEAAEGDGARADADDAEETETDASDADSASTSSSLASAMGGSSTAAASSALLGSDDAETRRQRAYEETVQRSETALQRRVMPLFPGESSPAAEMDGSEALHHRPVFALIGSADFLGDPRAGYHFVDEARQPSSSSSAEGGRAGRGHRTGQGLSTVEASRMGGRGVTDPAAPVLAIPHILTMTQPLPPPQSRTTSAVPSAGPVPSAAAGTAPSTTQRPVQSASTATTGKEPSRVHHWPAEKPSKKRRTLFASSSSSSSAASAASRSSEATTASSGSTPAQRRTAPAPRPVSESPKAAATARGDTKEEKATTERSLPSRPAAAKLTRRKGLFGSSSSSSEGGTFAPLPARPPHRATVAKTTPATVSAHKAATTAVSTGSPSSSEDEHASHPVPKATPPPQQHDSDRATATAAAKPVEALPDTTSSAAAPAAGEGTGKAEVSAAPPTTEVEAPLQAEPGPPTVFTDEAAEDVLLPPPPPLLLFAESDPPSVAAVPAAPPDLPTQTTVPPPLQQQQPPARLPRRGGKVLATSSDDED